MTLSWESEKLARTWCHCDGDFCTWKQSLAALRRASESAGYLFPVDPVCHNSKSRLEGDIDGSPFCGALPVAANDSNSEIICHKTRHADGSMHTTRCRMLCNKGFILPKHAKKVSRISYRVRWVRLSNGVLVKFRMGQYRIDDHREDAPHFTLS